MIPAQSTESSLRCAVCGAKSPGEHPPASWSYAMEGQMRCWTCDVCARENLDKIEIGLAMDRW